MNVVDYLKVLKRRWWVLVLTAALGCGAGFGYSTIEHKRYTSTVRMIVGSGPTISGSDEYTQHVLAAQRAIIFAQIAPQDPVVSAAKAQLAKSQPTVLDGTNPVVTASGPAAGAADNLATESPFFTIIVTADTPQAAAGLANSFFAVLPDQFANVNHQPVSSLQDLLSILKPANLPSTPSSPKPTLDAVFGAFGGLLVGIGILALLETLDTTLRDSDDVRRAIGDKKILGIIPREFLDEQLPAMTRPHSRRTEAYRQVRTNIEFSEGEDAPRIVAVTSPGQGDGKSSMCANLALLMSRSGAWAGDRVVLVDADMRKPTIARYFNASAEIGLSDVLTGRVSIEDALQPIAGEQLVVLTSGNTPYNPSELLDSPRLTQILHDLARTFDLVLVDTPPVLAVTDALLVATASDAVVVVSRMRSTTRSALKHSIEAVERVKGKVLGVVVNASAEPEDKRYGYGYGSYASKKKAPGPRDSRSYLGADEGPQEWGPPTGPQVEPPLGAELGAPPLGAARGSGRHSHAGMGDSPALRPPLPPGEPYRRG